MNRMLLQHESECQPDEVRCPPERTVMDQVRQFSSPDGRGSSIHPQLGTKMLGLKLRPPIRLPDPDQTHVFSSSMSFPPSQYSYRDLQGYMKAWITEEIAFLRNIPSPWLALQMIDNILWFFLCLESEQMGPIEITLLFSLNPTHTLPAEGVTTVAVTVGSDTLVSSGTTARAARASRACSNLITLNKPLIC